MSKKKHIIRLEKLRILIEEISIIRLVIWLKLERKEERKKWKKEVLVLGLRMSQEEKI